MNSNKPRDPTRKTSLVAGILYLVTFISSIPAVMLLAPVLNNPNYIISAGADFQVICGISLDLVNALAAIGTAVALFWVVKRQNESFALGFVATRLVECTTVIIGVVCILAVVTLRQTVGVGTDSAALVAVGQGLVAVRGWTFTLRSQSDAGSKCAAVRNLNVSISVGSSINSSGRTHRFPVATLCSHFNDIRH